MMLSDFLPHRNCYIAAGIYAVTMVVAAHQKWVNSRTGDTQKL